MERVQPNLSLRDDYNPAQMLVQNPQTGEYLLNDRGLLARAERAEAENARLRERLRRMERE